jgi:N-acetylmuramidase-like protein/putative peptidoglycan binding protein
MVLPFGRRDGGTHLRRRTAMKFYGTAQPLTRSGLSTALAILGLGPNDAAYIWTVVEVETAGLTQGFGFRLDRRPQILFERHIFRRHTDGRFDAEAPDISGPPGGYGLLSEQYIKLEKALALCAKTKLGSEPALQSASWGMGQVMGFNCTCGGYASCVKMVQAMVRSEDDQLACMAGFLKANGLAARLVKKDWAGFARLYNGASYWQNHYDVKLAEQFQRFASGSIPNLEMRTAQVALLYLGYAPGKIDGIIGPRTRAAIKNFRIAAGLPASEDLDGPTYRAVCKKAGIRP